MVEKYVEPVSITILILRSRVMYVVVRLVMLTDALLVIWIIAENIVESKGEKLCVKLVK